MNQAAAGPADPLLFRTHVEHTVVHDAHDQLLPYADRVIRCSLVSAGSGF